MNINDFKLDQTVYVVDRNIKYEKPELKKCRVVAIINDEDNAYIKVKQHNGTIHGLSVNEHCLGSPVDIRGFMEREEAIKFRNELVQKEIEQLTKLIIKL